MSSRWPGGLASLLFLLVVPVAALSQAEQADRPSHRPVNAGLGEDLQPEVNLRRRLKGVLEQHQRIEGAFEQALLDNGLKDLARRLLADPDFRRSLSKLRPQDMERLKDTLQRSGASNLGADPAMQNLLKESLKSANLQPQEKDLLKRWASKFPQASAPEPGGNRRAGAAPIQASSDGPSSPAPAPGAAPPPTAPPSQPSPANAEERGNWDDYLNRNSGWLGRNVERWAGRLDRWLETPDGRSWTDSFKDLGRRALESSPSAAGGLWGDRSKSLAGWLPRLGDVLGKNTLAPPPLPGRLPGMPRLAAPGAPRVSMAASGRAVLIVVLVVVLLAVAWRLGGAAWLGRGAAAETWRLGPWPVRPEAVSTRGELVRAFEHLALLLVGRAASTHNHRDLAGRMGRTSPRAREAADSLGRLYEVARYAPEDEAMPPAELERARRELCFLAGVTAA